MNEYELKEHGIYKYKENEDMTKIVIVINKHLLFFTNTKELDELNEKERQDYLIECDLDIQHNLTNENINKILKYYDKYFNYKKYIKNTYIYITQGKFKRILLTNKDIYKYLYNNIDNILYFVENHKKLKFEGFLDEENIKKIEKVILNIEKIKDIDNKTYKKCIFLYELNKKLNKMRKNRLEKKYKYNKCRFKCSFG